MPDRERDRAGRPQNARPRDELGRPLPRGAAGVPRVDETVVRTPDEAIRQAQELLDAGCPFHAHEVLEGAWKSAPPAERGLWKGLAQLAVGLTHLLRGNVTGGRALLGRGAAAVAPYTDAPPHGLDVAGLAAWAGATVAHPGSTPVAPRLRATMTG